MGRTYPVEPGGHAEVAGITGKGRYDHSQQGVLVVAYRDGRTDSARLRRGHSVQSAIEFAAWFNMACSQADRAAGPAASRLDLAGTCHVPLLTGGG